MPSKLELQALLLLAEEVQSLLPILVMVAQSSEQFAKALQPQVDHLTYLLRKAGMQDLSPQSTGVKGGVSAVSALKRGRSVSAHPAHPTSSPGPKASRYDFRNKASR